MLFVYLFCLGGGGQGVLAQRIVLHLGYVGEMFEVTTQALGTLSILGTVSTFYSEHLQNFLWSLFKRYSEGINRHRPYRITVRRPRDQKTPRPLNP